MTKTVASLFQSELHAIAAASQLEQAGIPRADIDIWSTPHNLAPLLEDDGLSRADAYAYAEGVTRGGSVVIVKCGPAHIHQVVGILDREGVLDLDEQQATWRSEGWEGAAEKLDMSGADSSQETAHGRARVQDRTGDASMQEQPHRHRSE